jgi:hypothetical protein
LSVLASMVQLVKWALMVLGSAGLKATGRSGAVDSDFFCSGCLHILSRPVPSYQGK